MRSELSGVIREISVNERTSFESLLNTCFPVRKGNSFFQDFPVWDPTLSQDTLRLGYFQGDRVMGSAGVRFAEIQIEDGSTESVALVGAVATHPTIRGHGVASDLIEAIMSRIDAKNPRFTLLWGSEHDLYRRFGFELAGEQVRIPLKVFLKANEPHELLENEAVQKGYFGEIFKLRFQQKLGLKLNESDQGWYGRHPNVQWRSLMRQGKIVAYVAFNRGIDLEHMVHEWSGSIEDVLKLFTEVLKDDSNAEWLTSPQLLSPWGINLPNQSKFQKEFLCMARPGVGFDSEKFSRLWIWGLDAC